MQLSSTITSKGQVLIPVVIRNLLNLKPLDRITFSVSGSKVIAEKATTIDGMYGFVKTKKRLTDKQLEKEIAQATYDNLGH